MNTAATLFITLGGVRRPWLFVQQFASEEARKTPSHGWCWEFADGSRLIADIAGISAMPPGSTDCPLWPSCCGRVTVPCAR